MENKKVVKESEVKRYVHDTCGGWGTILPAEHSADSVVSSYILGARVNLCQTCGEQLESKDFVSQETYDVVVRVLSKAVEKEVRKMNSAPQK